MPFRWTTHAASQPTRELTAWPNRSLPRRGFAGVIGAMSTALLIPLLPLLGTPALWGLLPFLIAALAFLWVAIQRNYADGRTVEVLRMAPDRIELVHRDARGAEKAWEANPYWVSVHLHEKGGPVDNYLTLKGGGREVELGAFLSADERATLYEEMKSELTHLPAPSPRA